MSEESLTYHQYLLTRSALGKMYRRWYLYPRLIRYLPGRVLDMGCGIGDFCCAYPNVIGVDINPFNVEYCRKAGLCAELIVDGIIPFPDGYFDSAIMDNVLEHLSEPEPVLEDIRRVLKPAGRLLVGVPGHKGYAADSDHKKFYDEASLEKTLTRAGFEKELFFYVPFRSEWLDNGFGRYCLYGVFQSR